MHKKFVIALLAGTMFCAPVPARAEPISTAIGLTAIFTGLGASVAVAGALGGALIGAAVSVGISLVSNLLTTKAANSDAGTTASGSDLNTTYGGDVPRASLFGLTATAGQLIYANVYGGNNDILQAVYAIGDGLHDGLSRIWYNGQLCTIETPDSTGLSVLTQFREGDTHTGAAHVYIRFYNGTWGQTADPDLVAHANPTGRWTTNHRGRGVCYVVVFQTYSEALGLTGYPQVLFEVKGLRLYDVRKDSTAGGSGSHRWGDQTTYEWTANPAVQEYNFRRGVYINDQLVLGMGVGPVDLIKAMYVAAANACEEDVALKEGGTEKRYRCGFTASSDRQHADTITVMRDAMAGYSLERVGQFGPIAGVYQFPSFEFTDDDFEVGKSFSFSKYRTRSEIATAIHGNFSDPAQQWAAVPFPARIDTDDDDAMGERLERDVDLTQVYSSSQAQRVAEIERRRLMLQANGVSPLTPKFTHVQPGDFGTYTSARHGTMEVIVKGRTRNPDRSITIVWDAIDEHAFSWTTAGEEDPPAVPTKGQHGTRVNLVTGLGAVGINITADNGLVQPGFAVSWDPITDPTVDKVVIEYRVHAIGGAWSRFEATVASTGLGQITRGIQASTLYDFQASLIVHPDRPTGTTSIITATSGANHVVPSAVSAVTVTSVPSTAIIGQIVEEQIANAAITTAKLHDQAVAATKFAAGIAPTGDVASLPSPIAYTGPKTVFNQADGKLYRYTGGAFTAVVPTTDLTGLISDAQIAGVAAAKLTTQIIGTQITDGAVTTPKIFTGAVTTDKVFAGSITTDKLAVGTSSNKIWNSDGLAGLFTNFLGYGAMSGVSVSTYAGITGIKTAYIFGTSSGAGALQLGIANPDINGAFSYIPCVAGQRYEFSFYSAANASVYAFIAFFDNAGTFLTQPNGTLVPIGGGGNDLAGWTRPFVFGTAPAGAVTAFPFVYYPSIAPGPFTGLVACPYFGPASVNQTEISPWAPAGSTIIQGGQIVTGSVDAGQIHANAIIAGKIAADAVTAGTIAAAAVNTRELVAGAVTADIIAANAIVASKIAVSGTEENILLNGGFEDVTAGVAYGWTAYGGSNNTVNTLAAHSGGHCVEMFRGGDSNMGIAPVHFVPCMGETVYEFAIWKWPLDAVSGPNNLYLYVNWYDKDQLFISGGVVAASDLGPGWSRTAAQATSPAFTAFCLPYCFTPTDAPTSHLLLDDFSIRRASGVTMIEDGAITTNKIFAEAVTATKISAGAVEADKIAANAVSAGKISAGAIDATSIIADNIIVAGKMVIDNMTKLSVTQGGTVSVPTNGSNTTIVTTPSISFSGGKVLLITSIDMQTDLGFGSGVLVGLASGQINVAVMMDGAQIATLIICPTGDVWHNTSPLGWTQITYRGHYQADIPYTPSAGSHTFSLIVNTASGAGASLGMIGTIVAFEGLRTS